MTNDGFEECSASFHAEESALAVPTELLSRPLLGHANLATRDNATETVTDKTNGQDTFSSSLQQLIASRFLYRTLPTLEQVAAIIGISPRTIQRCLQDEGLTYRRLIDRICFDAACDTLANSQMTITEISRKLGYSGSNNFVRGFKRIAGVTPTTFRRQLLDE